ncbi:hypothetical protein NYE76_17305 [Paenibacillus sp. FSL M7-0831]
MEQIALVATIRIFVWLENVPGPLASPGLKSPVSIMACRQAPIFRLSPKIVGEKLETSLVRMGTGLFHIGSTGNPENIHEYHWKFFWNIANG